MGLDKRPRVISNFPGDGTAVGGGIYFNISDGIALGLGASADDDVLTYGASVRFYFDN